VSLAIHQIHYRPEQIARLDPAFVPYNNAANGANDWCEWRVIREAHQDGLHKRTNLVGFVSWKFTEKTGITGKTLLSFIGGHPGFDLYLVNPYHDQMVTWGFRSIWEEAEQWHKGVKPLMGDVFERLEPRIDLSTFVSQREETCYCNYWVANGRFWDAFMAFAEPITAFLDSGMNSTQRELLDASKGTTKQGVSFKPFIAERLLTTFLVLSRGRFTHIRVPLPFHADPAYQDCARFVCLGDKWKQELANSQDRGKAQLLDLYLATLRADYLERKARLPAMPMWRKAAARVLSGRGLSSRGG
jgi:hypothetical protein